MICPTRSIRNSTDVIASPNGALRASRRSKVTIKVPSRLGGLRCFSLTQSAQSPTATPPRKVSVFLPHEDLKLKAAKAATSTTGTSIIADHHDLQSYLRYHRARTSAQPDPDKRAKLSESSVYFGTRYEYLIQQHLQSQLGFRLTRIGGKGDGGVDLIGTWRIPGGYSDAETFKVLVQAKRLAAHRKPMPALMRELEGTLRGSSASRPLQEAFAAHRIRFGGGSTTPLSQSSSTREPGFDAPSGVETVPLHSSGTADVPTLGILITTRPLTDGIEKSMASSRRCLMYMCLEESGLTKSVSLPPRAGATTGSRDGMTGSMANTHFVPSTRIRQIAWNAAAAQAGLEGYDIVTKYRDASKEDDSSARGEATFMYHGRPVHFPQSLCDGLKYD